MDLNDFESCTEIAEKQQQQQQKQQQQCGIHKRNEVVPSSETSIGDDNKLTTTIATEHKQHTVVSVDGPSNGTLQKQSSIEKQFKNSNDAQESDDNSSISHLRYDSETDDSESHLIINSETERTDIKTASIRPTTTIKENGGTASMKQLANKHKSSNTIAEQCDSADDSDFSNDGEQFMGFSMIEVNLSKGLFCLIVLIFFGLSLFTFCLLFQWNFFNNTYLIIFSQCLHKIFFSFLSILQEIQTKYRARSSFDSSMYWNVLLFLFFFLIE